ncbi:SH3 domain-containing protein [Asticcacaulis sp. ZE23SCel15]|uniref:SH3 domain-containing protein n=1 Tax=Asticcacaulis sp. ZE23SCel15 TaxID=3059027 RepID=UPI00265E48DC|nr:SH3 domain-containing protein [Asticcacaulis sp. ZE23SCel15]WKL57810.1 SH3 domain-containing protein [Asticcacaulis sp. ZE23SCel15]
MQNLLFRKKINRMLAVAAIFMLASVSGGAALSDDSAVTTDTPSGNPVPRWGIMRSNKIYTRAGPSKDHKILWAYRVKGLPVQIISETREWRLICDPDGNTGWVAANLLSGKTNALTPEGHKLELKASPKPESRTKAIIRPRALASLDKCKDGWCKISVGSERGWVPQDSLWGTQTTPVCKRPDPFSTR